MYGFYVLSIFHTLFADKTLEALGGLGKVDQNMGTSDGREHILVR